MIFNTYIIYLKNESISNSQFAFLPISIRNVKQHIVDRDLHISNNEYAKPKTRNDLKLLFHFI